MRAGGGPPSTTLVMRGGALGDFLFTLPLLAHLRRRDTAPPRLSAGSGHMDLAAACGLAAPAFRIDDPRLASLWAGGDPSAARDLLSGIREVFVLRPVDSEAITRRLVTLGVERVRVLDPRPPEEGRLHAADHLAGILSGLPRPAVPRLDLPDGVRDWGARTLSRAVGGASGPRVLLLPGAGGEVKRWPAARFVELGDRLRDEGLAVAWSLGPVEFDRGTLEGAFLPRVEDRDLVQAAALLGAADVVVGNDTGTSHLAAAVGAQVVALFGPTHDGTWRPRGGHVRVIRAPGYGPRCPECPQPCPERHPAPCLDAIPTARVVAAVLAAAGTAGENARETRPPGGPCVPG